VYKPDRGDILFRFFGGKDIAESRSTGAMIAEPFLSEYRIPHLPALYSISFKQKRKIDCKEVLI